MLLPKFTRLELQVMDALWKQGRLSIREIQESFPKPERPVYTTIQTTVYRLEDRGALRRAKKISNAHIFEAVVSRETASRRLIDDLLSIFDGKAEPVMAHLVESGKLTRQDIRDVEKLIENLDRQKPRK
jgi:predicted transcriptional regulator